MLQKFIENGQVGQFKYADFSVWEWLAEQIILHNWNVILPCFGFVALFLFKPTRPFAIGATVISILMII